MTLAFFNRTDAAWHHAVIVNTADAWAVAADACEEEGLNTSAGIARGFAEKLQLVDATKAGGAK